MARYCPAGDGAFEDWVERCPECGRPLRDEPPVEGGVMDEGAQEIVWLTTAPNEPIAQMWAEDLRRAGIPVLLQPGGLGFGAWGSVATFEHHLHVRASDLARAQALLEELAVTTASDLRDAEQPGEEDEDEATPSS